MAGSDFSSLGVINFEFKLELSCNASLGLAYAEFVVFINWLV